MTNATEAAGCILVSIQNNTVSTLWSIINDANYNCDYIMQCPFNDLLQDTKDRGIYQSMTESAFLTIKVGII